MEINSMEKNSKMNKDLNNTEETTLKIKLFNFFYYVLRKKDINMFFCCLFLTLESLQLISYAFTNPHMETWNLSHDTVDLIQWIVGATRITPWMEYVKFNYYIIIYAIFCAYIFIHSLFFAMLIKFNKPNSKFYHIGVALTRYFTTPWTIFFLIPIMEIIWLPLKCQDNHVDIVSDPVKCWEGWHFVYVVFGVIFSLIFYGFIIMSSIFYFDPFNNKKSTTKIDTSSDSFLYFCKLILVVRFVAITDEYISIVILFVAALFNLKKGFENPTYNNYVLECIISIRNASFFWTYLILFISKLAEDSKINGNIYLLLFGYPLIITVSIIYYRRQSQSFNITTSNFNDVNDFLIKVKYYIKLIESYWDKNKSGKSNKASTCKKNEILLKGIISIHEETCVTEECPLKKFQENLNNFSIQKTCLLHYMNNLFSEGIRKFPNSRWLLMIFVQFNYDKKYNLNAAKTYLTKLEKQKNTLTEDYIIYSIKQNIASNNNKMNIGLGESEEMLRVEDTIEQKYRRLKFLVETTTKLYSEFWGILATNLTNNLNLNKLFLIGNKLNKFLNEINLLWENDLKNKKIDLENQSIAQWYAYFLREILKNKKRSDEITQKINEEQHYESRKTDTDKFDIDNLDIILENQDYVFYCRTNEKGECDIIQCSNSIVYLLGYTKQEWIGKSIETIMPSFFASEHSKMLSGRIKIIRTSLNSHKDNFRSTDKKQIFILPKTKAGYLIPINARFTVFNDDDFSNTYIIKSKFEGKDTKSIYAFYVLTKDDFTVDAISSSAINWGLSMDLLKKYLIKMNVWVRTENLEELNLRERFQEYEEEPKGVTWIYPDKIYPKNDTQRFKEDELTDEIIKTLENKQYMLWISKMKYNEEETLGYCFRFTEVEKQKQHVEPIEFQNNTKKHILFDWLRLNYVRTVLVTQKSANYVDTRPVISHSTTVQTDWFQNSIKKEKGRKKKERANNDNNANDDDSDEEEEEKKIENWLTKEKITEMQGKNSEDVKLFIFGLSFYGAEVSLEKHRPNKEKYPVGRAQEPEIKITISSFMKRIEEKLKAHPERMKNKSSIEASQTPSLVSAATRDSGLSSEFSTDASASLGNIFNEKSVTYIKIFSFGFFVIICGIISAEFGISISSFQDSSDRMGYMNKGYKILNTLMFTKFFVTEAIIANLGDSFNYFNMGKEKEYYIEDMMNELKSCRDEFSGTYSYYSNATVTFSKEYQRYIADTQVYIKTLSNNVETIEHQPFSTAMSRIPTSIFYVSTITDNKEISMQDRNAFELMHNLLNQYLQVWRTVTFLLVDDVKAHTVNQASLVFIFGFSFWVSVVSLVGLWKLITRFIDDREKPIDLFLTIKKKKFEELKNSSESFINKLLNKFFGNEETEEESMIDYSTNIKSDDINIIKFKTKNDYKQSLRTSREYLFNYIKIVIFFIIIQAYMTFKYCYNNNAMNNLNLYTDVFNVTHYSQSDILLSLNIMKSYYFNSTIEILDHAGTRETFENTFVNLSNSFENLLIFSYNTTCFLKGSYIDDFYDWLNKDISSWVTGDFKGKPEAFLGAWGHGFKSTISRFFEWLRFIGISFLKDEPQSNEQDMRFKYLNMTEFLEINNITKHVIRPWYINLIQAINDEFDSYVNTVKLLNIATFIVLLCVVIVLYCLVWKSYEDNLKDLLKTSVDLINLIPEEIKYQIVQKWNEEENKNE